ncbi:hypothetical protein PDESU_00993 [Pontiella desulfatans]|uniref:Uncharacterized protein n=1 Tax=Pontiella desulfatans TaxID=2750659 RepID=A0A6C2TYL3_PONDE|nr:multiheme c-type cytochrome [Pontiella desulfatans]VGO12441.1 hypothetical protein PDESU_00993 [Pontiella desulfatans]
MRGRTVGSVIVATTAACLVQGWTPKPVEDDPLVRMPGTQPGQVVDLESDKQCLSCHGGSTYEMENWKGSLMAQASRDPIFWAGMTVAAQDAVWALGTPNAADICVRCHFPQGWLDGRSDPVNCTDMRGEDYDGVSCKICHYMYDPFYQATYDGTREGNDWVGYWDENGNLQGAVDDTRNADAEAASAITHFRGDAFFTNDAPKSASYTENGGGHMFIVTHTTGISDGKRASFSDAPAKHDWLYSRYHKSKYMCGTCHDISNPALANLDYIGTNASHGVILPSESQPAYSYAHVERTFSEFMLSDFGLQGGTDGTGPYHPSKFNTSHAENKIATCQDCHFRDIEGVSSAKQGKVRPGDSTAHPLSGVPEHRMIGGNLWVPYLLASIEPTSPNYSPANEALLKQGPAALTLDFSQGESLDPFLLLETIELSGQMLQDSISMDDANYSLDDGEFTMRLQNHTGHKLISGYPEGRRMFLNVKAYANDELIYEINPYDDAVGTLKGLDADYSPNSPALSDWEEYEDELVYEVHQASSVLTNEHTTFHMALATHRVKDNRILPRGFRIAEAADRLCEPVWHGHSDTNIHHEENFYTQAEYEGGFDEIEIELPKGTERIEAVLYYQTTSREFIEFLRNEINGAGTLPNVPGAGGDLPYLAQTDPWFSGLKAWGDTIWQLWDNNKHIQGAAPVMMTNTLVQLDVSDTDSDGIPAYWEIEHFGGATNALAGVDSDGDGVNNLGEYIALTDPHDDESVFTFTAEFEQTDSATEATAEFETHRSRDYALEETTNLTMSAAWTNVSGYHRGIDDEMELVNTNATETGTYRVRVKLP